MTVLRRVDSYDGPILIQGSDEPVGWARWVDAPDSLCAHCDRVVLLRGVAEDQLWSIAIECHGCGKLSALPDLPPGRALPQSVVMFPKGRYLIRGSVDMKDVVAAGEAATQQHQREVGSMGASLVEKDEGPPSPINSATLRLWLHTLRDLLGSTFNKLLQSDRLGRTSPTPPKHRHGLMLVVQAIEDAIQSMSTANPAVDLRVLEAYHLLELLTRWSAHRLWPHFVNSLEGEYYHTIAALTIATFLQDAGNSIEFQEASGSARTPDLMLVLGARARCAVEIKSPRVLIDRGAALALDEATEILKVALKRAGTGPGGQLGQTASSFLAIAGFNLSGQDVAVLERAANSYLRPTADGSKHRRLMGILVISSGALVEMAHTGAPFKLSSVMTARLAKNPGYRGPHTLSSETRRPLRRIPGPD